MCRILNNFVVMRLGIISWGMARVSDGLMNNSNQQMKRLTEHDADFL